MKSPNAVFWKGKKVFLTGHTGFKGAWLSLFLHYLGAKVYGFSLEPPTNPHLFGLFEIEKYCYSTIGDIRNLLSLRKALEEASPDVVIHMAAQPLVRLSYRNPVETYETNVMGTVHLLEAVRFVSSVRSVVLITTDKCYENKEWLWGYRENEAMGGYDPYSSSKGCSELVISSYRNSFFNKKEYDKCKVAVASARAGNVIGGGDWAADRLIPDFIRCIQKNETIRIRSPKAIRPWQHVLEPLAGYLMLAEALYTEGPQFAEAWNFGPDDNDAKSVEWIVKKMCEKWGNGSSYTIDSNPQIHEATYLKLDCSKVKTFLGWYPRWNLETALDKILDFTKEYFKEEQLFEVGIKQIQEYLNSSINK